MRKTRFNLPGLPDIKACVVSTVLPSVGIWWALHIIRPHLCQSPACEHMCFWNSNNKCIEHYLPTGHTPRSKTQILKEKLAGHVRIPP